MPLKVEPRTHNGHNRLQRCIFESWRRWCNIQELRQAVFRRSLLMYARLSFQHWQWLIVGSRGLKIGCEQRGYISTGCISDLRKIQLPQGFCAMKLRGIPYECSLADVRSFITSFGLRPSAVVMETCADTGASYSLEQSGTGG